ncbi:MAG: helix-turn-helix domain-containing protein [Candidatus Abyssubacteria bacterium]
MTLGEKLKKLRIEQGLTLQDVAGKTGYSKALISRIENDSVSPSINSLIKISSSLHIKLNELFAAIEDGGASVVKKANCAVTTAGGGKLRIENVFGDDRKMRVAVKTFEPGFATKEEKTAQGGEEWWHVLKGKLEAQMGEQTIGLGEGDSIYIFSSIPHKWRNPGRVKASALVVSVLPPP